MKRTLSLVLSLIMILGIFASMPVTVNAEQHQCPHCLEYMSSEEQVSPTCTEPGVIDYYCFCGDVGYHDYEPIPATGHSLYWTTIQPTCIEPGYDIQKCENCGDTFEERIIPVEDHNFVNGTCIYCGEVCDFKYIIENNSVTITGYNGTETNVIVPSEFNGIPVTRIGYQAFATMPLTTVVLPDTIEYIGAEAFFYCTELKSITIPENVTYIGQYAFVYCLSLEKVYWNAKIVDDFEAQYMLFHETGYNCGGFDIIFGEQVESVPAFLGINYGDSSVWVKSVTIGKNVKRIGKGAFALCHNLKTVYIPENVTEIEELTFAGCKNLESINVSEHNKYYSSFDGVLFDSGKTELINYPAAKSNQVYRVYGNVQKICEGAFYECNNLKHIIIYDGVKIIDKNAFEGCKNLETIVIPTTVTNIGKNVFYNCNNIKTVCFGGSKSQWAKLNVANNSNYDVVYDYNINKPDTPATSSINTAEGVQVEWNIVDGATKYIVYRRQGGSNAWISVGTTVNNTILDKNVKTGIYYCYSVRAYNIDGKYSDYVSSNTSTRKYMAVPKLTGISNATNGLYIKWNPVAGVTKGYRVYRRGAGSTYWTYLGTVKTTYFTDTSVKYRSGEYFRYTVIADGGYHSKFDTTGLYLKRLANPELKRAVSSSSGITVKWETVVGTTGYYVYRKTANSSWVRIAAVGGTNTTSYVDTTAKKGVTYTYTVKAVYGATTSAYNSGISCKDKY